MSDINVPFVNPENRTQSQGKLSIFTQNKLLKEENARLRELLRMEHFVDEESWVLTLPNLCVTNTPPRHLSRRVCIPFAR